MKFGITRMEQWQTISYSGFFQKQNIFVQLDELDKLSKTDSVWSRCNLKLTVNSMV